MPKYQVDIYYSTFVTREVEADSPDIAIEVGREDAARYHNKELAEFTEETLGNFERWAEADIVRD